jgi:hypothetical protein
MGCPKKDILLLEERTSPLVLEIHNDFSILVRYLQYVIDRWHFLRPPRSGFIDMRSLLDLLYLVFSIDARCVWNSEIVLVAESHHEKLRHTCQHDVPSWIAIFAARHL